MFCSEGKFDLNDIHVVFNLLTMKQLLLLCLLGFALGGYINPYLRKPVEPSVNNALEVADYTFVFTIETDLFASKLGCHYQS